MMDGAGFETRLWLDPMRLGRLMPLSLWLSADGRVRAAGPTLRKLGPAIRDGAAFDDLFLRLRPAEGPLATPQGQRADLALRASPSTQFRALALDLGDQGTFLDLSLGLHAARAVRTHGLTISDFATTDLTVELLFLTEVKDAVMNELAAVNTRLEEARHRAETHALTDALTGLANRRGLCDELGRTALAAANGGEPFALASIDLDLFKSVNDSFGHAAGDAVLVHVAEALRAETRSRDFLARVGGDEFVILLWGLTDPRAIVSLGRRIIAAIERPIPFQGQIARVSCSIGVALSTNYETPEATRMLADADAVLYASKRAGRARTTIHDPAHPPADDRRPGHHDARSATA